MKFFIILIITCILIGIINITTAKSQSVQVYEVKTTLSETLKAVEKEHCVNLSIKKGETWHTGINSRVHVAVKAGNKCVYVVIKEVTKKE